MLDYKVKKRYAYKKLSTESEYCQDPYSLFEEEWIDDITKWPSIEFSDVYNYLINSTGCYTKDSLKAYKSLEAYNYFVSGHVQTVNFHESSEQSKHAILMVKVNRSQKSAANPHETWVITCKEDGQVMSGHCTCTYGWVSVCIANLHHVVWVFCIH